MIINDIFIILYYVVILAGMGMVFYALYLAIRALQIYIKKNS